MSSSAPSLSSSRPMVKREARETDDVLEAKYTRLVDVVANARNIVFLTGAGISTSASVPDFEGDSGLRKTGVLGVQEHKLDYAMPTYAHRALAALASAPDRTRVNMVVTSNHDNLHARAGTPPTALAELFGNAYVEDCLRCGARYRRSVIVPPMKRRCDDAACGGRLKRLGVRYGETVPYGPLKAACDALAVADLVIVLGSSLHTYMFEHLDLGPRMVIANLQPTPFDDQAILTFADYTDAFMDRLMASCFGNIAVPTYVYTQAATIRIDRTSPAAARVELLGGAPNEPFTAAAAVYAAPSAAGPWTELSRSMITGVWAGELAVPQNAPLVLRVEPSPGYIGAAEHVWTVPSGDAVASGVFEYTPAQ
ncbi:transcriptional regulator [Thecamonas trahens ATCC 50062]|uniref:Transcriptional regulator n=1 Tax=Thecamonas trahens ATCC 50062 TaxID=461836 RepID=A0A0L0D1T0_THETB|nr:transcriptional regulator [Thecamonas trahens ATCC 50062]KNC46166.1 transcriptional regulator [Thecamonas trahens ATCC 50062]|eukprot:XP_013763142.1 transcriptional regulator [Thecamonas trahens ATCC 50062]